LNHPNYQITEGANKNSRKDFQDFAPLCIIHRTFIEPLKPVPGVKS
jgi:hypothetical protein